MHDFNLLVDRARRYLAALMLAAAHAAASAQPGSPLETTRTELRQLLEAQTHELTIAGVDIGARPLLRRLYQARDYQVLWSEDARRDLLEAVAESARDGLRPGDYPVWSHPLSPTPSGHARASADLVLSEALARLAYSLYFGKANPRALDPNWNYARSLDEIDPVDWLARAIASGAPRTALAALRPSAPFYHSLASALAEYRAQAARGGWPTLSDGPTLKPGMRTPRVSELRARLGASGELHGDRGADLFDAPLRAAVETFQARHGLAVDGAVGRQTRAALNVPVANRIQTLRVNLERVRWVFHHLDDDFLAINIASFNALHVVHGRIEWRARVVVGKPFRQTPIFRSRLSYLELNPTWTVPPTILREDILPRVRRDVRYLETKHLQVLDRDGQVVDPESIDWQRARATTFPYLLRQPPGDENPLGRIKFMFPNRHAVYLHDTPARELFDSPTRSFSSGCIRIEHPLELAHRLLEGDPTWTPAALDAALATGIQQRVELRRKLPILLLYLTAFPGQNGAVEFRADVYDRDPAVLRALDGPFQFAAPSD
jgi:murein L,D-transpeptidase YcbB/YkuD